MEPALLVEFSMASNARIYVQLQPIPSCYSIPGGVPPAALDAFAAKVSFRLQY